MQIDHVSRVWLESRERDSHGGISGTQISSTDHCLLGEDLYGKMLHREIIASKRESAMGRG